jgi:hypothetical protein
LRPPAFRSIPYNIQKPAKVAVSRKTKSHTAVRTSNCNGFTNRNHKLTLKTEFKANGKYEIKQRSQYASDRKERGGLET